jgi:hypothetical protein
MAFNHSWTSLIACISEQFPSAKPSIRSTMNEHSVSSQPATPLPADNPKRPIKVARPSIEQGLPHIGLVGDTYTILLSGKDTNGRYCLIDMHIPPGGGPPPHRHDFEESGQN